jgi:hypothetical protein
VSAYPVRIHCASLPPKPSSLRTEGSAIATIVRSSTATNEAQHNSTSADVFLPGLPLPSDNMRSSSAITPQPTPSIWLYRCRILPKPSIV